MHVTQIHCCTFWVNSTALMPQAKTSFPSQEFTSSDCITGAILSMPDTATDVKKLLNQTRTRPKFAALTEDVFLTANSNYPQKFSNSSNTILHWSTVWAHFRIMQNISALFFIKSVTTSWLEEKSTYGSSLKNKRGKLQSYSE